MDGERKRERGKEGGREKGRERLRILLNLWVKEKRPEETCLTKGETWLKHLCYELPLAGI